MVVFGAAISLGKDDKGKRLRKVITGKTEDDVKKKMDAYLKQNNMIEAEPAPEINEHTLVEEFVKEFKSSGLLCKNEIGSRTYENYEFCLGHFETYFKNREIGQVDTKQINKFFKHLVNQTKYNGEHQFSSSYLRKIEYIVGRMFARAVKKKYIEANPFDDEDYSSPKSKQKKTEILALDKNELEITLDALRDNKVVYPVIVFMLYTGVRTQEVLGLKWKHLDLDEGIVQIREAITFEIIRDEEGNRTERKTVSSTTKRGTGNRDICLPPNVVDILRTWKKEAPEFSKTLVGEDDYVFGNSKSNHWTYGGFRTSVNRYLKSKTNTDNSLRLHRIRHTLATSMAENGATTIDVMQQLGHTQVKTTMKYIDTESKKIAEKNRGRIAQCFDGMHI